jgi:hypothetical protein
MPTTVSANVQQVLQMGSHTEKLQHTVQNLPNVVAQQVDKARQLEDELKRRQVQNMDSIHLLEETDSDAKRKKLIKVRKNNDNDVDDLEPSVAEDPHENGRVIMYQ